MPCYICVTCGSQFAESARKPDRCPICDDERQYVGRDGQQWTTLAALQAGHRNRIEAESEDLLGIGVLPGFAINQRALLVCSPGGNLLWDCVALVDDDSVARVHAAGGIRAIAISHPHYYSGMVEWSRAFDDVPIHLHAADREWVMRDAPAIRLWEGDSHPLWDGITLLRCGGHFAGGTVAHIPHLAEGRGALLTGDVIQVAMDRRHVGFMRSFPNYIPLSANAVRAIAAVVQDFDYDDIHGAWFGMSVKGGAQAALDRSVQRYLAALDGAYDDC